MENFNVPVYIKLWISTQRVVFFILFCLSCSLWGQEGKKILEEKDYAQWETVLPNKLSYDGQWLSYGLAKNDSAYKIIIQNIETDKRFVIDSCYNNSFSAKGGWFCALDLNSTLTKINLHKEYRESIPNVKGYQFEDKLEILVYFQDNSDNLNDTLFIEDLKLGKVSTFENIVFYEFSPNGNYIALIQQGEGNPKILVYDLLKNEIYNKKIVTLNTSKLHWQPDNQGLSYWEENGNNNEIFWWMDITDSLQVKKFNSGDRNFSISNIYRIPFHFSYDSKRLFFQAEKLETGSSNKDSLFNKNVEVWNTKDEVVYPAAKSLQTNWPKKSYTIVWNKKGGEWKTLGNEEASMGVFGEEGEFAYSYSSKENSMATWDKDLPSPIIVYNIEKGTQKTILENNYALNFFISPSGRYLTYFKDSHWFLYDAKNETFTNLTRGLNTSFAESLNKEIPNSAYGSPIWTEKEKEIALYDGLDIWLINMKDMSPKRITNGKETNRKFRFHLTTEDFVLHSKFSPRHSSNTVDLSKGAIFSTRDMENGSTGYATFSRSKGMQSILFGDALFSNLRMSKDGESIIFSMESYENPPKLIFQNLKKGSKKLVYQSNPQHFNYQWGKEELVDFKSIEGKPLKGILYYPSGFDPTRKYPMIVSIYEIQSKDYHKYHNPTLDDRIGFSISNFTTKGYFVFLPDIIYKIGDPGVSALNCVMAGLDKIFEKPYIDQMKVGLYGHSFGGYESMFILTQTDRFATVVAGAGASNLLSYYLSMAWIWNRPQYTRFERQQWRMGNTYFNIPDAYHRNSPINFVSKVSTPFLSWAGKQDSNVNWEQHLELYLALRKLQKEHIMLLYPEEGHDITNPDNQEDLTQKIMEWFDYYLKNLPAPEWMTRLN